MGRNRQAKVANVWGILRGARRPPAAVMVVRPDPGALAAVAGAARVGLVPTKPAFLSRIGYFYPTDDKYRTWRVLLHFDLPYISRSELS